MVNLHRSQIMLNCVAGRASDRKLRLFLLPADVEHWPIVYTNH